MTTANYWLRLTWTASCALLAASCSASAASTEEGVENTAQALLNSDEFVYFRCGATSFGVDDLTRLRPTSDPNVGTLTYNVTQDFMVTSGDQCIFTRTNQFNGWGQSPASFTDTAPTTPVVVPGGSAIVAGTANFKVKYPATGSYTISVNWAAKTFQVSPSVVNIVGHLTSGGSAPLRAPLPAITVNLTGTQAKTTVTDANGNYRFQVPAGAYTVTAVAPSGGSMSPNGASLGSVVADTIQDFSCSGTCSAASSVVPGKELVVTDPTVLTDARTSNVGTTAGPWSFRAMIEQMTPNGVDPADFANAWLGQFEIPNGTINGFPVSVRTTSSVRSLWPLVNGKLDLQHPPFQLLAIMNRLDVGAAGTGEGRFVYGLVNGTSGQLMTVIFEYGLPDKDPNTQAALTRSSWATKFHALGAQAFGSSYNTALQAVTDLFTKKNTSPSKPGGSSINQVRSNEIVMGGPWQLREFHLTTVSNVLGLRLSTTANTPVNSAVTNGTTQNTTLVNYLNNQSVLIHGGYATFPGSILGGESNEDFTWSFTQTVNQDARHDFAGMTCNGCHNSETSGQQLSGFYHVSPVDAPGTDGTGRLSSFIKTFEIPRRKIFLQNLLTCSGATCSAGGEAMFTQ